MEFRRAAIIYNPVAGGSFFKPAAPVEEAADELRKHVGEVRLYPTRKDCRADELTREALGQDCDLIAPCGGDGTINEALQGLQDSSAVLLPLPAGTANVLAYETGLPLDPVKVAAQTPRLTMREAPLGVVEFPAENRRRYFLLMCGAGVDAGAVYRLNVDLKRRVGVVAYFWSAIQQLFLPFERLHLDVGGERLEATLAVLSKSRLYGGNLVLTPNAHLLEKRFDVVCFRSRSPLAYTGYLAQVVTRTLGVFKGVERRRADRAELLRDDNPNVYVQVDGELAGSLPALVRMGPETVRILAPEPYWRRYETARREAEAPALANG